MTKSSLLHIGWISTALVVSACGGTAESGTATEGADEGTDTTVAETTPDGGGTTGDASGTDGDPSTDAGPSSGDDQGSESTGGSGEAQLLAGAAMVTLLPEVDGSTAYFDELRAAPPLAVEPGDPGDDPGVFVEQWDVGTIAIGNGYPSAHWVHDEIRAGAVAFRDALEPGGPTLVLVSADVYMMFGQDIEAIREEVRARVGEERFANLEIIVAATHNHMGPDTSGLDGINHAYYEYLIDQVVSAIVKATDPEAMRPAKIKVANSAYQFGNGDGTPPYVVDPNLNSMQVRSTDDDAVIATLVQWQSHPETVLWYGMDVVATQEQAEILRDRGECFSQDEGATCHVEGQYISAGFPGYAVRTISEATDAPALYFNGAVGAMLSPLNGVIWETEGPNGLPAGNGFELPEGEPDLIEKNFHRMAVAGLELAKRVLSDLESAEEFEGLPIEVRHHRFYTRLSNMGFRIGLVVDDGVPVQLGHRPRMLYTCEPGLSKNDENCVPDDYQVEQEAGLTYRQGDHLAIDVSYARLGPVEMVTIPGEATTELTHGLPVDFIEDPERVYYRADEEEQIYTRAEELVTPGYVEQMMSQPYKWFLGLSQDSLGYILPRSNWRALCIADVSDFGGEPGLCQLYHQAGVIDYADPNGVTFAIAGDRCKAIHDDPSVLAAPPYSEVEGAAQFAMLSCQLGPALGEPQGHYEETNSVGWDIAEDWVMGVAHLLEHEGELEQTNPDFVGHNLTP